MDRPQTKKDINWDDLVEDMAGKKCVLFLGPALPVYSRGNDKLDFYSLASEYLAQLLKKEDPAIDLPPNQDLYYIAQRYLQTKNNFRPRLEAKICTLYKTEVEKLKAESTDRIPSLYKTILQLPWNTIINMQPDNFFQNALRPDDVFSYYHYRSKEIELKADNHQFLVYNLFGALVNDGTDYNVDSLVLTEGEQVEFVLNLLSGNPKIPECLISRLDSKKTYIFLDCNLENWYFRLLMEVLKMNKESRTFSPRYKSPGFSLPTKEFYQKRYGFVFVDNNSEEFMNKLWEIYTETHQPKGPKQPKKIVIAFDDSAEKLAYSLIDQFKPWIEKKELSIWTKDDIEGGDLPEKVKKEQVDAADGLVLLINAPFLNDNYASDLEPALAAKNTKQVFAVIESACPWEETPLVNLPQRNILPKSRLPVRSQQDTDAVLKEIATSITKILWE